jgi:pimeloyl-ACP methyl ester carboxylesterase
MDVDAVRRALGYDTIDYYAFSYGSVDEQAYAARFPQHLHALAIDAGMPVTDPGHAWMWSFDVAHALPRIAALLCKRQHCGGNVPAAIDYLDAQVRDHPVNGDLGALHLTVGEPELINMLRFGGNQSRMLDPDTILAMARGLQEGDPTPLLDVAALNPRCCDDEGDPRVFSQGDNIAAFCNDVDFVWNRGDATVVRKWKLRTAVDQLPKNAAAPFSVPGWNTFNGPDLCLYWPPPTRFVPAVPPDATVTKVPTIIFSGDVDAIVPTEVSRKLLSVFPHATFVTVAGASHPAIGWRGDCVSSIALHYFDTLRAGNTRCAARTA